MVEVVGLIASVVTIAQLVIEGIKHARTFYRAQKELEALQARLSMGAPMSLFPLWHLLVSSNLLFFSDVIRNSQVCSASVSILC